LARKPECLDVTQSGPDVSAQFVARVARLSWNVRQPDRVLANRIAGHKAERRPGAGEEWRAVTEHEGAEVESILIDKTNVKGRGKFSVSEFRQQLGRASTRRNPKQTLVQSPANRQPRLA